jgi:predicted nucleotidyltransferase component of viral defense system
MAKPVINRAASIKQKLLTLAREQGRVYEVVLVRYALERLLYRLSISQHRDKFILKGGMLVTLWLENSNRETRDVDFLGYGENDQESLKTRFIEIMAIATDDGLEFDLHGLTATAIREDMAYEGVRLRTLALLERSRIPVTIDVGFGDALAPAALTLDYPSILGMETPSINTYPPAMVVAEKFQAMVALGVINGRMKDYFDLWAISQSVQISGADLDMAIGATFARRKTEIPKSRPPGLSELVLGDLAKQGQWRAYTSSINLKNTTLGEVVDSIWGLVGASCARLGSF